MTFSKRFGSSALKELHQFFPMDLLKSLTQKEITAQKELVKKDYEILQKGGVPTILQKEFESIEKNSRMQSRGAMLITRAVIWYYDRKAKNRARETTTQHIIAAMQDDYWIEEEKNILEDVPEQIIVGWLEAVMVGTPPKINDSAGSTPSYEFSNELYPTIPLPDKKIFKDCETWTDYIIQHTKSHLNPLHAMAILAHFLRNVREAAAHEDILLPYHRRLTINSKGTPIITLRYNEK